MPKFLLGLELPLEAEVALRTLPSLDSLDPVLQAILDHQGGTPFTAAGFRQLQQATSLDSKSLGALFTGVDWMVRTCMRSALKPKALATELTDLKVAAQFVAPIVTTIEQGCAGSGYRVATARVLGAGAFP